MRGRDRCRRSENAVGLKELDDILDKIASVRLLERWCRTEGDGLGLKPTVPFRSYGSPLALVGTVEEQYDQHNKRKDQIWGFAVARSVATGSKVLVSRLNEFSQLNGATLCPNRVISMSGICAAPCLYSDGKNSLVNSSMEANAHVAIQVPQPLAFLVQEIATTFSKGRTVSTDAFLRYIPGPHRFDTVEGPSTHAGHFLMKSCGSEPRLHDSAPRMVLGVWVLSHDHVTGVGGGHGNSVKGDRPQEYLVARLRELGIAA